MGEIWGALSVADHLGAKALVAEVLLFDRLVIPIPPPGDDEQEQDWTARDWDPGRLRRFLGILGDSGGDLDLAVPVPWTAAKRALFSATSGGSDVGAELGEDRRKILAGLRSDVEQLHPDARMVTRLMLTREYAQTKTEEAYMATLPRTWVESVVPAYQSFEAADRELSLQVADRENRFPATAEVVGWELFVPDDDDWSDERSLEAAVELARSDDYRDDRETFRQWWRTELEKGRPAEDALRHLTKRADKLNSIARAKSKRTRTLRSFALFGGPATIAGIWCPPVAIAGGVIALVSVGAEWLLGKNDPRAAVGPAAMFHSARKQLGWY
jgi:ketosteroid isomerase-like protein